MTSTPPLRIALYAGIVVRRDAVSWSLLHKLEALRRLIALGAPIELTVFAQSIEDPGPECIECQTVGKLLGHHEFWDADLHIFEEGMYYELFDAIHLIPPEKPILAIEHNSTPVELVEVPSMREAVQRSHDQRRNLLRATHVACVSELNLQIARAAGVAEAKLSVLHLPPAIVPSGPMEPLRTHLGPVRLLYLGRFVRAKGIADMLTVTERLFAHGETRFHVTLAGDPRFSDPALMDAMREAAGRNPGAVEILWAPDDATVEGLLSRTDALVIPSFHEGYCVPVVEAYGHGRFVVAYAAGNLPNIMGGLGATVPTGDVAMLESTIRTFADHLDPALPSEPVFPTDSGPLPGAEWRTAVRRHLESYSTQYFERTFLGILASLVGRTGHRSVRSVLGVLKTRVEQLDPGPPTGVPGI